MLTIVYPIFKLIKLNATSVIESIKGPGAFI
jgi:hypothetical protein